MNNHNVKDLDLLYADAKEAINCIVSEKIDGIALKDIDNAINNLEEHWHGQDAVNQINNLIGIKNLLISNRDIIGNIGIYLSMVAKRYRDAQNSNSALLPSLPQLNYSKISKSEKISNTSAEIYMSNDISNTITILNNFIIALKEINSLVSKSKDSIFDNWIQDDENRNYALTMFDNFTNNSADIIKKTNETIKNINTSIDNYNSSVSAIPSLESIFNDSTDNNEEYSDNEIKVLNSIEKNFENNKKITDNFNNILIDEVRKDLIDKGIIE